VTRPPFEVADRRTRSAHAPSRWNRSGSSDHDRDGGPRRRLLIDRVIVYDRKRVCVHEPFACVLRDRLPCVARSRDVRTEEWLYIRNFQPERWPAGDPELVPPSGPYGDIDSGPSKTLLVERQSEPAILQFFALATAPRPAEELYT
jgi:hypothetical protein